ncbi:hypothetical protein P7C70_g9229, partial [Phenoliferia sp. Uapishka_3]
MSNQILVTLPTTPPQPLLGFTTTSPVTAHSSPLHPSSPPIALSNPLSPVSKWLGIPYGTAQRFAAPEPFISTDHGATRECYEFGTTPLQNLGAMEPFWVGKEGWLDRDWVGMGEDCSSLNIFRPEGYELKKGELLPVMVWIYGGALNTGHSAAVRHDATELVRQSEKEGKPCIVVTSNYRVNIFGFLSHPDLSACDPSGVSGNYGFHDQILMLKWVKNYISLFNGDPSQVTVFGESA